MTTAIDFFCGAGGSSTGLVAAGLEVRGAVNHWALAIETHNTNHPTEDCGFRMLEPRELKRGMSFPDEYVILGNKRDQVRQIGNAVCCRVAQWLGQQVRESLS